jgi:hypothetical protein
MFNKTDDFVQFKIKTFVESENDKDALAANQRFTPEHIKLTCPLHDNMKFKYFDEGS